MFKSLKARLVGLSVGVLLVALLLATAASYLDARGHLRAQTLAQLNEVARGQAQAIGNWTGFQASILKALVPAVQQEQPRPALIQAAISGGLDFAYIGHADKRMLMHKDENLPPDFDPTARPWYRQAAAANEVVLTEPYLDTATQQPVVTFALAVKEGGQTKAVIASDVFMTGVVNILKAIKPTPSGFALPGGQGRTGDGSLRPQAHPQARHRSGAGAHSSRNDSLGQSRR